MSRKRARAVAAATACLAAALLLAACGGGGSSSGGGGGSSSESGGTVEIEWWHGQNNRVAKVLDEMIDEFEESHPNIVVSKDSGGVNSDRMLQKVTAGLQADDVPDIAYIYGSDLASLAKSEKLANLSEAVKNGEIDWNNFVSVAQEAATVEGEPRAFPSLVDNLAVVYNKKIFQEEGVSFPPNEMSWEEFLKIAEEVNDPSKGIAGFAWPGTGDEDTTWRIWPLVWQKGGEVLNEDGTGVGFEGEPGEAALEVVQQAAEAGTVYIDPTAGSERMQQLFNSEKLAMNVTGPWALPEYVEAGVEYGVTLLPSFTSEHTTISGPDTWAIFDNGEEREHAAIEFLDWFSEPEQQLKWLEVSGSLPLTENVSEAKGYAKFENSLPGLKEFIENTKNAKTRPTVTSYPEISTAIGKGIAEVLYKKADAQEALEGAVSEANHELELEG
ncbi:MAG: ABC transporter substrate-binding protein [Solirubrobacterales bacterium]